MKQVRIIIACFIFFCCFMPGAVRASDAVSVVEVELTADEASDSIVKLTWEVELKNESKESVDVSVELVLYDAAMEELKRLSMEPVTVPASTNKVAVQTRPLTAELWAKVDSHEVELGD